MSWPDDKQPRFVVTSVTGFRIDPGSNRGGYNARNPPSVYQVLDRAYNYKLIAEWSPHGGRTSEHCCAKAETYAAALNNADRTEDQAAEQVAIEAT